MTELNEVMKAKKVAELLNEVKNLLGAKSIAIEQGNIVMTKERDFDDRKDKTKGIISESMREVQSSLEEQGFVFEKADMGRGFQVFKDYSKDSSGKLKRLVR